MDINSISNNYKNSFIDANKDGIKQTGESLESQIDKLKKLQPGENLEVLVPNPKNQSEYFAVTIVCKEPGQDYSVSSFSNGYSVSHLQGSGEKPVTKVFQAKDVSGAIGASSQGVPGKDNILHMWSYVDGDVEQLGSDGKFKQVHWSVVDGSTYKNWVQGIDFEKDMQKMLIDGGFLGQNFQFPNGVSFQPLAQDNLSEFIGQLRAYSQEGNFEDGYKYGRGSSDVSMSNAPDMFKWVRVADKDMYLLDNNLEISPHKADIQRPQAPSGVFVGDLNVQCLFTNSETIFQNNNLSSKEIYEQANNKIETILGENLKPIFDVSAINGAGNAIFIIDDPNFSLADLNGKLYCTQSNERNWVNNKDLIISDLKFYLNDSGEPVISLKDFSGNVRLLKGEQAKKLLEKMVKNYQSNSNNTWHNQINQRNLVILVSKLI